MKILVTGANGFIAKNLIAELHNSGITQVFEFTRDTDPIMLETYTQECDFVFHLAGVNRPQHVHEFMEGNVEFTSHLLELLKKSRKRAPLVVTSSSQAELNNAYGNSKKAMEALVLDYGRQTGVPVYVYRLPNVFGKWSKPNYNSVVATYCHHIARNEAIEIHDPDALLTLCYIDDVLDEFLQALSGTPTEAGDFYVVPTKYTTTVGELATKIQNFKDSRVSGNIENMQDPLTKKLYSTYVNFLPEDAFAYDLKMHVDHRGSFTEFIRTPDRGQVSINRSKPGIEKGNHWHHTKNEKFLVVSGEALIRLRKIDAYELIEYRVSGEKLQVVDIPTGYTHAIINVGNTDLVTVIWVNECFDPVKPDTYYLEV